MKAEIFQRTYDNLELDLDLKLINRPKVFIKPNLVQPVCDWDTCSVTRIEVIEAVIRYLKQFDCQLIRIGDCGFKGQWKNTIESTGYDTLPKRYGVELVGLQEGENFHKFSLIRLEKYISLFGAKLSDYLLECDLVINVPKMKVHGLAMVTGAIKNMMGVIIQKGSMHPGNSAEILHKRLVDFYNLCRNYVKLVVMDGIEAGGYCEQTGVPCQVGTILVGEDMWEVDVLATQVMGMDPRRVPYLETIRQQKETEFPRLPEGFLPVAVEQPLIYRLGLK